MRKFYNRKFYNIDCPRVVIALLVFLWVGVANAYSVKQFSCPLNTTSHLSYFQKVHPEVLNRNQTKFKPMWTRSVEKTSVEDASRVRLVKEMYAQIEGELKKTGALFDVAYNNLNTRPDLSDFFEQYVQENHPRMKRDGRMRRRAARQCRTKALAVVTQKNITSREDLVNEDLVNEDLVNEDLEDSQKEGVLSDDLQEFQNMMASTCFMEKQERTSFQSCLENISTATLMCTSLNEREELKQSLDQAYSKFQQGVQKAVDRLEDLDTEENLHDRRLRTRSHREMRILLTIFPRLFNDYVFNLNAGGRGDQFLKEISDQISNGNEVSEESLSRAESVFQELVQLCRVDKILDNRKIMSTVMTVFGATASAATIVIGPVFGLSLLPQVMNAGSTIGVLAAANSTLLAISLIDKTLTAATLGDSFRITKLAKVIYQHIKYQKELFDLLFAAIQKQKSEGLSENEEGEVKKVLIDAIKVSEEYRRIKELYVSTRRARMFSGREIISLFSLVMNIAPTITFNQALAETIRLVPSASQGIDAVKAITRLQNSALNNVLKNTSMAVGTTNSVATEIFINEGRFPRLSQTQLVFLRELLIIFFGAGNLPTSAASADVATGSL